MSKASACLAGALILVCGTGAQVLAGSGAQRPNRSGRVQPTAGVSASTSIPSMSVAPASLSFNGTDPDLVAISASNPITVNFTMSGGKNKDQWSLEVWAGATTFASCPLVEDHAVTITCTSAIVGYAGGGGTASCSNQITLSASAQTVASGKQDTGSNRPFTVTLAAVLNDQWRFTATTTPCTLTLNYRLSVP